MVQSRKRMNRKQKGGNETLTPEEAKLLKTTVTDLEGMTEEQLQDFDNKCGEYNRSRPNNTRKEDNTICGKRREMKVVAEDKIKRDAVEKYGNNKAVLKEFYTARFPLWKSVATFGRTPWCNDENKDELETYIKNYYDTFKEKLEPKAAAEPADCPPAGGKRLTRKAKKSKKQRKTKRGKKTAKKGKKSYKKKSTRRRH